jgi:hypothetical protein
MPYCRDAMSQHRTTSIFVLIAKVRLETDSQYGELYNEVRINFHEHLSTFSDIPVAETYTGRLEGAIILSLHVCAVLLVFSYRTS